ncbi:MAG: hypothetical protein GC160_23935 [Acidobacteria bacterium]|nr:hypothetical protein [Acidobacteriota bacterium]
MDAVWEIPFALASFVFYKVMRVIMRCLVMLNSHMKGRKGYAWGVVSAEPLQLKIALPALMTTAPRWNTHAIIGGAGPFHVERTISFDVAALQASAGSWTVVLYSFPWQRFAGMLGSIDGPFEDRWRTLELPPGTYNAVARLYRRAETIALPEIRIDGEPAIAGRPVDPRTNDFYFDLPRRRGLFYLCLHFYIYTFLRVGAPRWLIEPELLPMGNPETVFKYGAVKRGEALAFHIPPAVLAQHDVYFTLYTRDSFPALWHPIAEPESRTEPVAESGFYLLRLHALSHAADRAAAGQVRIETLRR